MSHSFFIHSSIDGHSGGFRILTVINSIAMNTEVHIIFFQISVISSDKSKRDTFDTYTML